MQPLDPLIEAFIILSTFDRIDTNLHASASIYSRHLLAAWPHHRYAGYCSRLEFGVGAHSYVPSTLLTSPLPFFCLTMHSCRCIFWPSGESVELTALEPCLDWLGCSIQFFVLSAPVHRWWFGIMMIPTTAVLTNLYMYE